MTKKTALITGASYGLGYELCKLFANDGYDLVLVARNKEKLIQAADNLKKKYDISVKLITKDLSLPKSPDEIFAELQNDSIHIDILVNNAGAGVFGPFYETDLSQELEIIRLNISSVVHMTKLFVPEMMKKGGGKILNVASIGGFQPIPLLNIYASTKAFIISFSNALANELKHTHIGVSALCPGAFRSGFGKRAKMENSATFAGKMLNVKTIAKIGYIGLMNNKQTIIPGIKEKILVFGLKFIPRIIVPAISRYIVRDTKEKNNKKTENIEENPKSDIRQIIEKLRSTKTPITDPDLKKSSDSCVSAFFLRNNSDLEPFKPNHGDRLIYVGSASNFSRRMRNHLENGSSTLRKSLWAILKSNSKVSDKESLTQWMEQNLEVGIFDCSDYKEKKEELIAVLNPVLNLTNRANPHRKKIRQLRQEYGYPE